jgi:short-subunit dehydrogenase
MKIKGSTALVTGANRGIGFTFAEELLRRGAAKVYVAARDVSSLSAPLQGKDARLVPVRLDVTDAAQVAAAAAALPDVDLLINNAGFAGGVSAHTTFDMAIARQEMEVNYFGMLSLTNAFAPALKKAGGGAIVNVLSFLSLVALPAAATYSGSKAAALSVTRSLRAELAAQHTSVIAVMPVQVDTDMGRSLPPPHLSTMDVVGDALDAVESGQEEVFPGELTRNTAQAFAADPKAVQAHISQMLPTPR